MWGVSGILRCEGACSKELELRQDWGSLQRSGDQIAIARMIKIGYNTHGRREGCLAIYSKNGNLGTEVQRCRGGEGGEEEERMVVMVPKKCCMFQAGK